MEAIGSIYTRIHTINVLDSILPTLPWSVFLLIRMTSRQCQ